MTMSLGWQELYRAALLEAQPEQLRRRIDAAEEAICQRLEELRRAGPDSDEEQRAIADARRALRVLGQTECQPQGSLGAVVPQREVVS